MLCLVLVGFGVVGFRALLVLQSFLGSSFWDVAIWGSLFRVGIEVKFKP